MNGQRQASPADEADLEVTAELPVLDVASYEANVASATAATATYAAAANAPHEHDQLNATDTWHFPAPGLHVSKSATTEAANTLIDQNRARLEVNLQALSSTLRDVEGRLTRKGERLTQIEKALELAVAERNAAEQRARALADEVMRAEAAAAAQARLLERTQQLEAQLETNARDSEARLGAAHRDFEARFANHAQVVATLERELRAVRERNTEYLEALHSNEGRRSVFEDLIAKLAETVEQRELRISQLEIAVSRHTGHESDLNGTLAERNERIRALEETVSQQTAAGAQLRSELERMRGELERGAAERAQLVAAAASLETSLEAATARGDRQEALARAAQTRLEEHDAGVPAQRRRVEQLEAEVAAVRVELQSSSASVQTAAVERNEHVARIAAGEARIQQLEARITGQQETVRQLQAESNASMARAKELENELHAARQSITDRDGLIERLEQETAASAVLVGHIQKSITRLDGDTPQSQEPAGDGATRLMIRVEDDSEVVHVLGRKTTVGRTPDNDLQIDAKFISRHHAVIVAGHAHAIIEDLNSTNGVTVNNRRITRQTLTDGDTVVIGKTQFRYVVRPGRSAAAAN